MKRAIKPGWHTMTGPVYALWMIPFFALSMYFTTGGSAVHFQTGIVIAIVGTIAWYVLAILRFHAVGLSAWWAIVVTIPLVWIVVACLPSLPWAKNRVNQWSGYKEADK